MVDLPDVCLLRFAENTRRELGIPMVAVFLIQFILVRFYVHAEMILLLSPIFSCSPPFSLFLPFFPPSCFLSFPPCAAMMQKRLAR